MKPSIKELEFDFLVDLRKALLKVKYGITKEVRKIEKLMERKK